MLVAPAVVHPSKSILIGVVLFVGVSSCAKGELPPRANPRAATAPIATMRAAPREAPPLAASAPPPLSEATRECGTSGWTTYGHDPARTSASDGCASGALETAWVFAPAPFAGRVGRVHHAIVAEGVVYAGGLRGNSPVVHRLAEDGTPGWTFDSRADIHRDHWPSIAEDQVLLNDDGLYVIDPATGRHRGYGLDSWGPTLTDGTRIFLTNTLQVDGPGFFVAAYDRRGNVLWKGNKFHAGRQAFIDDIGGLCLDRGLLFHAAGYKFASHANLTAFEPERGEVRWRAVTLPVGAPSAAGGRVFTLEESRADKRDELVARSTDDGSVVWTRPIAGARGSAPVLAGALVIVHGDAGVVALNAATGEPGWSQEIPRTKSQVGSATSLAAALGSGTLVVTSGEMVHVLSLADGSRRWSGAARAGATDVHSPIVVGRSVYVVASGALVKLNER